MKLSHEIEEKIKEKAVEFLSVGRTDFDVRHTLCAVKWMKKLIEKEGGSERVSIPAIYFHDTGYEELRKGYNHEECLAAKLGHAKRGVQNAKEYFPNLNYFTEQELDRIYYLIENHDVHNNVAEDDRQLILEADGLGQIDWEDCPPSYDKENCLKFLDMTFSSDRIPYVKTKAGKEFYDKALEKAYKYLEKM